MTTIRGQVTIPDLVYLAASLVVLAAMTPAIYSLLSERSPEMSPGTVMLFQLVVPGLVMTLILLYFAVAVGGGS